MNENITSSCTPYCIFGSLGLPYIYMNIAWGVMLGIFGFGSCLEAWGVILGGVGVGFCLEVEGVILGSVGFGCCLEG